MVLVVGSSYSGSTLLGLLIGTDPRALYAGEVNQIRRLWNPPPGPEPGYRFCTCGETYADCPLWGRVSARYASRVDLNPAPGLSARNLRLLVRILFGRSPRRRDDERLIDAYRDVVRAVGHAVRATGNPGVRCLVDSSKSLESLEALARARDLDLRVVHLLREAGGVMASARRRRRNVWGTLLAWVAVHGLLRFYLTRRTNVPVLEVDYRRLCEDPRVELRRVGRFLDLDLQPDLAVERIRRARHHVLGGSKSVRPTLARFEGIEHRPGSSLLRPLERSAAALSTRLVRRICGFSTGSARHPGTG